ncbi:TetR family transcriptional regulator, partial [Kitasatospora phosalacinea]|uniref:TetR family transcriptional regulator n=1 Tax=Kitasatospora phosalacinea TaxID=2065 RepID=UPI00365B22DE
MKQDRARRTHALILDAAATEFAAHGAVGGSIERVAQRIGLTKGALYGHFASKGALMVDLLDQFDASWQELLTRARQEPASGLDAAGRLLDELAERLGTDVRFACGLRLATERSRTEGRVPDQVERLRTVLVELATLAQEDGELAAAAPAPRRGAATCGGGARGGATNTPGPAAAPRGG